MNAVSFTAASDAVRQRLGEAVASHSLRVAATARDLALAYHVDADLAEMAGLLHDWDRELSHNALLAAAQDAGIECTPADEAAPYLLHARTASVALARALPGLPSEVLTAISNHTLGSADMSDLDKVVYLADMLEPGRRYPGVDDLRAAVGVVTLGELFARGYQHSLAHLVSARHRIHPQTISVWNELVAGGER